MRLAFFFTGIALSCVVQGAPIGQRSNGFTFENTDLMSENICGKTTFQQTKSSQTPTVNDCNALMNSMNGFRSLGFQFLGWNKGHLDSGYIQIGNSSTCAFGAKPLDANDGPAVVTWGDTADVIKMALGRLVDGDMIEGMGTMECQVSKHEDNFSGWKQGWNKRKFQWQIFAPGTQDNLEDVWAPAGPAPYTPPPPDLDNY